MFKAGELEAISMALEPQFRELEQRVMSDIVRRISINGEITRAADWQVTRLAQLGESKREIKKAIKDTLGLSTKEVNHLYKDVLRKGYEREAELYKYKGRTQIPFVENKELQQLIGAVSKQTDGELKNITQSLGFAKRGADGKLEFTPVADYYQKTLDSAMFDISSGAFDYNTVLKRTVKEMTNSGLRSVDYATGHSNRVDVAARRAIMTGMSQLTAKVNESNAEQLGTNTFEVTAHGGARPEHQEWQGRWYTKDELESICGLGEVTGLCGANCYHDYYPVVPGISEPTYTAEQIEEFNRKENEPVEYNGKTYTKYEATQRQRKLETTMRAQRQEIKLLKEGGASEDDLIAARSRYRGTSAEYARFSKAMDLPQQRERVTVDGLGNIGQGKYKVETPPETKQDAPQQTQDTQKDNSPAEQNNAVQSVTEPVTVPDNVNIEFVDKPEESGIIEDELKSPISSILDKLRNFFTGTQNDDNISVEEEEKLLTNMGFKSVDKSFFENVNQQLRMPIVDQLNNLEERFGAIKGSVNPTISAEATGSAVAKVSRVISNPSDQKLILSSSQFKNPKTHISKRKKEVEDFYCMPCKTDKDTLSRYVVTHEYGHMLENSIISEELKGKFGSPSNLRLRFKQEIENIAKDLDPNYNSKLYLSKYGEHNDADFFAECFANSQLGVPNLLGNAMNVWLERRGYNVH